LHTQLDAVRVAQIGSASRARSGDGATPSPSSVGATWAEIARFVGQRKLSITADTYTHVMADGREADLAALLAA
jgi:hypothetical protein